MSLGYEKTEQAMQPCWSRLSATRAAAAAAALRSKPPGARKTKNALGQDVN
jgi:hypothetical protein